MTGITPRKARRGFVVASAALTALATAPLPVTPAHAVEAGGATAATRQVEVTTLSPGQGASPAASDWVLISYKGMLADGTVFDQRDDMPMSLENVVPGFAQGLVRMQRGGKYRLSIPWELGYGEEARGPIPARADLTFEIELLDFKTNAEVEAMVAQMRARAAAQAGDQEQLAPR